MKYEASMFVPVICAYIAAGLIYGGEYQKVGIVVICCFVSLIASSALVYRGHDVR